MTYEDYNKFCHDFDMKIGEFIRWLREVQCKETDESNREAFFEMLKGECECSFIGLREDSKLKFKGYF